MDSCMQSMAQKHERHLSFYPEAILLHFLLSGPSGKMKTKDSPHTQHSRSHSHSHSLLSCVFYPESAHSMLSKGPSGTSKLNKLASSSGRVSCGRCEQGGAVGRAPGQETEDRGWGFCSTYSLWLGLRVPVCAVSKTRLRFLRCVQQDTSPKTAPSGGEKQVCPIYMCVCVCVCVCVCIRLSD